MESPETPSPEADPAEAAAPAAPRLAGVDVVRDNLKRLPPKPGVYRMYDEHNDLLYVGKARNLKNRVGSYAKLGGHTQRIARMISLTRSMEFVVTASETEALLLEANLIKRLKPRFNIILRDDKSFPHILIREDHEAPQVLKHRGAKRIKGQYFGPFASAGAVDQTLDTLQKAFLLRTCTDSVYATRSRPCMLHQMGRCSAPCVGIISLPDYAQLVSQAESFLNGEADALQTRLSTEMESAAQQQDYERAARLRDRIRAIASVRSTQGVNPEGLVEADVFAIHTDAGQSCVQAFFFRAGQNWGATAYYPKHDRDDPPESVLAAFLAQFYDDRPVPKLILLSHDIDEVDLIQEALELRASHKVELRTPQRGEKREIVGQALLNAREALGRKLAETQSQARIFAAIQKIFDMPEPPRRIEVYDNSHIMGTNMVGGMVVAGPEGFEKNSYRKFNIKDEDLEPGDDYGMMREVMRRRFSRLKKEAEDAAAENRPRPETWPDLVLIDGGLGQLSVVRETVEALGFAPGELNLVAIAKGPDRNAGREQFFRPGRAPFQLPPSDPALYYLQRLRDEAHRWAIGAHRAKRSAQIGANPLDDITGVGAARKKALLHRFGSARGVSRATVTDLQTVEGVNAALAQRIYDHFHGGG
ncbi:MAG: excinuclease ABC subunit UvrC [Alphaproteobacteria bacterium]|nr:excinuclease ABC subunit UvrC [Alphaproteobacteria bacterium]